MGVYIYARGSQRANILTDSIVINLSKDRMELVCSIE